MCVIRRHFRWVRANSRGNVFFAKYGGPSGGSQQSGGKHSFRQIRWPVRWVPAVRWRNHYFPPNKEALPCCRRGPSCQPLHVQSTSDGCRSLTMLTRPRQEHQGGGRWRGLGRERHFAGEDAVVDAHAERSTRVHWFGCGVRMPSPQGLASGGSGRGVRPGRQYSRPREAGAGGTTGAALGGWTKKARC